MSHILFWGFDFLRRGVELQIPRLRSPVRRAGGMTKLRTADQLGMS